MVNQFFKKIVITILLSLPNVLIAADATNPNWQINVAPYLWAINMDGRVAAGPFKTHIDENFSEILRQFDGGGMLWVNVHKGPVGGFFNGIYAVLSDHGNRGQFDAHLKTRFGIMAAGLSYIILQKQFANSFLCDCGQFQIEPYAGFRYTFNHVRLNVNELTAKNNQGWTDFIIGSRFIYDFNSRWNVEAAADVGGRNRSSQYSYNLSGLIGYKPAVIQHTALYLGYRYLYQHYTTGSGLNFFEWNMRLFGPLLGIDFYF